MSMLLHSSHGFNNDRLIEDMPNEIAKTLADQSTAIMKLAGCEGADSKSFYDNPRGTLHAEKFSINFNIRDTTLSRDVKSSHCAYGSIANIFARLSIADDFNYISACAKARSAVKLLSNEQYKGLKESVGNIYTRMTQALSKGRCKVI